MKLSCKWAERPTTLARKFLFPQRFISTRQWYPAADSPQELQSADRRLTLLLLLLRLPRTSEPPVTLPQRPSRTSCPDSEVTGLPSSRRLFFFLSLSSCRSWMNGRGDGRGWGECEITGALSNSQTVNTNRVCVQAADARGATVHNAVFQLYRGSLVHMRKVNMKGKSKG